MATSLANKVFCLTGAASGIGLATARVLLAQGASLGLMDIHEKSLDKFCSSLDAAQKDRVFTRAFDVADRRAVKDFLEATKGQFGYINGMANIAGVNGRLMGSHEIWQLTDEEYDHVIDTNIRGVFNFLREALRPGFLEPASSIVNVSSLYGIKGAPLSSLYCTSKHAVVGLTRAAAYESGSRGIRVNSVAPGAIFTPLMEETSKRFGGNPVANTPIPRVGEATEVANVIAFLLGPESTFVTGAVWPVDGGAST